MTQPLYPGSANIVQRAVEVLGKGNKGLADRLGKDPSLISRYACGMVRPKAETLLQCIEISDSANPRPLSSASPRENQEILEQVQGSTNALSVEMDLEVIQTIYQILRLAKKI